jgi:glycerophosphoryl diester phosphodiesterase
MKMIAHRGVWTPSRSENSLPALLDALNRGFAIETDIRQHEGEIVLSHDPVRVPNPVATLEDLLKQAQLFPRNLIFLNVKEDGLLPLLQRSKPWERHETVFFDMSTPELVRYSKIIPKQNLATRWSDLECEPVLYSKCDWLWVDCFEQEISFGHADAKKYLTEKRLVFVSPQLHGRAAGRFLGEVELLERELQREMHVCLDVSPNAL